MKKKHLIIIAALAAFATIIWICLPSKKASPFLTVTAKTFEPPAAIGNFDPINGGVLMLTANEAEQAGALKTLRERNSLRKTEARMKFENTVPGITKVTWKVRKGSRLLPVHIFVANSAMVDSADIRRHAGAKFPMVMLRGHTSDMSRLYEISKPFQKEYCYYLLGGCQGSQLVSQLYQPKTPVLADTMVAESANNTYLLVRTVDLIGSGGVTTWEQYVSILERQSKRLLEQTIVPGQQGYAHFIVGK